MTDRDVVNRYNPETKTYEVVPRTANHSAAIEHFTNRPQTNIPVPVKKGKQLVKSGKTRYQKGGKRSIRVLQNLRFDPITALVEQYRSLENELSVHEGMRDGTIVKLTHADRVMNYDSEAHMRCYEMMIQVGDKLLRYGYARVPENVPAPLMNKPTFIVQTTDGKVPFTLQPIGTDVIDAEMVYDDEPDEE